MLSRRSLLEVLAIHQSGRLAGLGVAGSTNSKNRPSRENLTMRHCHLRVRAVISPVGRLRHLLTPFERVGGRGRRRGLDAPESLLGSPGESDRVRDTLRQCPERTSV